ncbi:MAG TPA: ABC transporter permease [Gemmatimonadaceae bacterium]|nr:ABC transporter permease [Gemmatimonadaceae bacterium]
MDAFLRDLRYTLRALRRSPGFTLVAVLSLALGIGANTTIFSVANAFLFQAPRAERPGELVRVYTRHHSPFDFHDYGYFKERNGVFSHFIGERTSYVGLESGGQTERVAASMVSADFFPAIGLPTALGRAFAGERDEPGAVPPVVLTHRFWKSRFGGDPSMVGQTLRLNGSAFTVVGVAAEGFTSSVFGWRPDFFVPLGESKALLGQEPRDFGGSLYVTARLKPGVSSAQANAELQTLMSQLRATDTARYARMSVRVDHARGINAEVRQPAALMSAFLMVVVGLVLLVACANVANLLLARATTRRREVGIRLALGASRWSIVRQLLTESVLLALVGGGLGLVVAMWATDALPRMIPNTEPFELHLTPDGRVLAFTTALCLLTGVLFGLAPALQASSPDVIPALRDDATVGGYRRSRLRSALVVAQVTLSLVLLTGSTLFLRSLANAHLIDPGFDTRGLYDASLDLGTLRYDESRQSAFYTELLRRARELPGVRAAALAALVPLSGSNMEMRLVLEGAESVPVQQRPGVYFNVVSPGYLAAMGIPLMRGREFGDQDVEGAPQVAVLSEAAARRMWPDVQPGAVIGRRLSWSGPEGPWVTVVGIARDSKFVTLGESPRSFMYVPFGQSVRREMVLQLRAPGSGLAAVRAAARDLVKEMEPRLPPVEVKTVEEDMQLSLLPARAGAGFLGTFGLLALVLATVGIYGVTSYAVAQRTREIGIRAALGAGRREVLRLVLAESMRLVALGMVLGLALALGAGRLLQSLLYGVSPTDPLVFAGTPVILAVVALLATLVPARRAARVDPMVALRHE